MRLTCPTCGAHYEVAEGLIDRSGQHVQCTACHARWFERPSGRGTGQRLSEDEIIARLDQRAGGGPLARPGRRPPEKPPEQSPDRSPERPNVSEQETEFRWERKRGEGDESRPPAGHLRVVGGGNEARPRVVAGDAATPQPGGPAPSATAEAEGGRPDVKGPLPQPGGDRPAPPADTPIAAEGAEGAARPPWSGTDLRPSRQARQPRQDGHGARYQETSRAASARRLDLGAAEPVREETPRRRRRTSWVVIALVLLGLLVILYAAAEPLAGIAPWALGPIEGYAAVVDGIWGEGEARLASLAETLRGVLTDDD